MKEKLQSDLKTAMKSGDKLRLMTVRGILSEVTRLEKEVCRAANEDEIIQIIKRERARRDESLDFARRGKRFDLITQYEALKSWQRLSAILAVYLNRSGRQS